jgi:hypothetical protein
MTKKVVGVFIVRIRAPDARHFVLDKLKEAKSSEEIQPKDVVYGFVELDVY